MAENNAPREDAVGTEDTDSTANSTANSTVDDTVKIHFLTEDGKPWMEADGTTEVVVEIPRGQYDLLVHRAEENGRTEEEELRASLVGAVEALSAERNADSGAAAE